MGRHSREKGAVFERKIAEILRSIYPDAKRGIGQTRAATEVADVAGIPFWVECKHQHRVNIAGAVRQAQAALIERVKLEQPRLPLLVVSRSDRQEILATMLFDDFLDVLRKLRAVS